MAEGLKLEEEIGKLNRVFGGIKTMDRLHLPATYNCSKEQSLLAVSTPLR
jgi:hypothetical protein